MSDHLQGLRIRNIDDEDPIPGIGDKCQIVRDGNGPHIISDLVEGWKFDARYKLRLSRVIETEDLQSMARTESGIAGFLVGCASGVMSRGHVDKVSYYIDSIAVAIEGTSRGDGRLARIPCIDHDQFRRGPHADVEKAIA